MSDRLASWMKTHGVAVTRERYIGLNWGSDAPTPWTPELEAELPDELQDWSSFQCIGDEPRLKV